MTQATSTFLPRLEVDCWGELMGQRVQRFTLRSATGTWLRLSELGATLTEFHLPDRNGQLEDIVLGLDSLKGYAAPHPHFGGIVGRVTNRIHRGQFQIDGHKYQLPLNEGRNHIHGGFVGFDRCLWQGQSELTDRGPKVILKRESPNGEEGYPGRLSVSVTYLLTDEPALEIEMEARCDSPTLVNLTQHTYWNLGGHGAGLILDHEVQIHADHFTPMDLDQIPIGVVKTVEGSALDFRKAKILGATMPEVGHRGFDHNLCLEKADGGFRHVASVRHPNSGRQLNLATDQPCLQLYASGHLDGSIVGKQETCYPRYSGLCLETQFAPDTPNQPDWPSIVLRPGERYLHRVHYGFEVV